MRVWIASTGTPALFVHPAEAAHGDLGMVTRDDAFIALSNSGASGELLDERRREPHARVRDAAVGEYWRTITSIRGRLVTLSAVGTEAAPLDPAKGRTILNRAMAELVRANPALAN